MTAIKHCFEDGPGYEHFMGRWSQPLGHAFLRWLSPPAGMKWLDVGCGTGTFTRVIWETCSPASVTGIDSATAQIEHAVRSIVSNQSEFRVADAQHLPFSHASFDVVASMLALNFVSDTACALGEMRRVARAGSLVAGCVWDFAAGLSPSWPIRRAMLRMGFEAPPVPGAADSSLGALRSMFQQAGFERVTTTRIEVTASFQNYEELWRSQTPSYAPIAKAIAQMPSRARSRLQEIICAELPLTPEGRIEFISTANAVAGWSRQEITTN